MDRKSVSEDQKTETTSAASQRSSKRRLLLFLVPLVAVIVVVVGLVIVLSGDDGVEGDVVCLQYPQLAITNNSSEPASYYIEVAAESPDGKTIYDRAIFNVGGVTRGQITYAPGLYQPEYPETEFADAVCRVTKVEKRPDDEQP